MPILVLRVVSYLIILILDHLWSWTIIALILHYIHGSCVAWCVWGCIIIIVLQWSFLGSSVCFWAPAGREWTGKTDQFSWLDSEWSDGQFLDDPWDYSKKLSTIWNVFINKWQLQFDMKGQFNFRIKYIKFPSLQKVYMFLPCVLFFFFFSVHKT